MRAWNSSLIKYIFLQTTEIGGYKDSEAEYNNTCNITQIDINEIISLLKELQLQVQQTCTARCEPSCNQIETQTEIQTDPKTEIPTQTPTQTPTRTSTQTPTQTQAFTTKPLPYTTAKSGLIVSDPDEVCIEETQSNNQTETQTQTPTRTTTPISTPTPTPHQTQTQTQTPTTKPLPPTTAKSGLSDPDEDCSDEKQELP